MGACMRCRRLVIPLVAFPHRWVMQRPQPPPRDGDDGKTAGAGGSGGGVLEVDTSDDWMKARVVEAVREGRQSQESADYFESIMHDKAEFRQYIQEARRLLNDQDPRTLTKYQQGHYMERLSTYMSGVASERLMQAHREESGARRHSQDGTPTGENYWFEAGNTLASPSVPGFVKDDILRAMRSERSKTSTAFEESSAVTKMAENDDAFAEHLRKQRRRLLQSDDYLE